MLLLVVVPWQPRSFIGIAFVLRGLFNDLRHVIEHECQMGVNGIGKCRNDKLRVEGGFWKC